MENYPPQFEADAVVLYESPPEATIRSVTAELRETNGQAVNWLHRYNTRCRHSRLGRRSPIAFENAFHLTATTLAPAA